MKKIGAKANLELQCPELDVVLRRSIVLLRRSSGQDVKLWQGCRAKSPTSTQLQSSRSLSFFTNTSPCQTSTRLYSFTTARCRRTESSRNVETFAFLASHRGRVSGFGEVEEPLGRPNASCDCHSSAPDICRAAFCFTGTEAKGPN